MTGQITAYRIFPDDNRVRILPAPRERAWMDRTTSEYAYRCLPMAMANQLGWSVYPNTTIALVWDGTDALDAIKINDCDGIAASIFGFGIVTFHIMHLIQTPADVNLFIGGQTNHVIPGIQALNGYMESDWAPYTFTMNWQMTHPGEVVVFTPNDAICHFFPVSRGSVESYNLQVKEISEDPVLAEQHDQFNHSRRDFHANLKDQQGQWQKNYFQGKYPDGSRCPVNHQTKLTLKGPK